MAVWSSSTKSDYYIIIGVFLAITLVAPCISAPTPEPWWYNPCDNHVGRIRHGRSAEHYLTLVKRQLKTFIGQLGMSLKNVKTLYKHQTKTETPFRGKLPWLKIKKMLNSMRIPANRLTQFHEALQFFAGTLETLHNIQIRTNASRFSEENRKRLYENSSFSLKLLLCEVQYTLQEYDQRVPPPMPLKKMKIRLPKALDLTGAHVLDQNFFRKMQQFFKRSQKLFRDGKKKLAAKSAKKVKTPKKART